jgi:succinate dehydrogenase/fumarate reductase flavoprotein subunit
MWKGVGIVRTADSLKQAQNKLQMLEKQLTFTPASIGELELFNMLEVAKLITKAALDREESRGAHYRKDFPVTDDKNWKRHLVYKVSR